MTQISTSSYEASLEKHTPQEVSRILFSHYSQLDPDWGFELGTERTMCGLVCVKSVIDHYNHKLSFDTPHISTLLEAVNTAKDFKPNGISHAVEVDILKSQGLVAWRRNWNAPSSDTQWLVDNESYSEDQISSINAQQDEELLFNNRRERELVSIMNALNDENPVIASVKPGFGENTGDHQVVIVGKELSEEGESFVIMDPEHAPGSTLHLEPVERFFEYFNDRAIFVRQSL